MAGSLLCGARHSVPAINQRVFRYDALAERDRRQIADRPPPSGRAVYAGWPRSHSSVIPVLGFFMPVYGGLAFIHYGLERLGELRSEPIEGAATRV
jgi:hypothetical protein